MNYRIYTNSKWIKIDMRCGRCQSNLYNEVLNDGQKTRHFTCERLGCTWCDYKENEEKILEYSTKILLRNYQKERIDNYRKSYPSDHRSDLEILKCIKKIESDARYTKMLINDAVANGGYSEEELKKGYRMRKAIRHEYKS